MCEFGAGVVQNDSCFSCFGLVIPEEEIASFGLTFLACVDCV